LPQYEVFLDIKDIKHRTNNVFLELTEYSNKEDREVWHYYVKFPTDRDNALAIEENMGKMSDIFNRIDGALSKINFLTTLVDLTITEFKSEA
jgi:hypothetical protein